MDTRPVTPKDSHGWHKSENLFEASYHAWQGILHVFRTEKNMRLQVVVYAAAIVGALLLGLPVIEIVALIIVSALILVLEMINTSLEHLADIIEPTYHKSAGRLKDVVAGAVMLASFTAILVGILLFGPPLVALLY